MVTHQPMKNIGGICKMLWPLCWDRRGTYGLLSKHRNPADVAYDAEVVCLITAVVGAAAKLTSTVNDSNSWRLRIRSHGQDALSQHPHAQHITLLTITAPTTCLGRHCRGHGNSHDSQPKNDHMSRLHVCVCATGYMHGTWSISEYEVLDILHSY